MWVRSSNELLWLDNGEKVPGWWRQEWSPCMPYWRGTYHISRPRAPEYVTKSCPICSAFSFMYFLGILNWIRTREIVRVYSMKLALRHFLRVDVSVFFIVKSLLFYILSYYFTNFPVFVLPRCAATGSNGREWCPQNDHFDDDDEATATFFSTGGAKELAAGVPRASVCCHPLRGFGVQGCPGGWAGSGPKSDYGEWMMVMVMVIAIAMAMVMVMVMVMILSFGWSILVIYLDSCLCFPELVQSSPVAGCPHHRQPSALVAQDPRQFQRRWLQHDVILPAFNKLPSALFPVARWLWILHWWRRTSDCNWLEQTVWCQHNRKL